MTAHYAEYVRVCCERCQTSFEVRTPERLGDEIVCTCPSCDLPLRGRWYGQVHIPNAWCDGGPNCPGAEHIDGSADA